jgi:lipopolysaccharide biosynthesis protein
LPKLVFINYWKKFIPQKEKDNIIYNNEIGFTKYFSNLGFRPRALFDYNNLLNTTMIGSYGASEQIRKLKEGKFVNPTHHFADLLITQYEFPFIKIELLRINPAKISGLDILMLFIKEKYPDHYALLADHLNRISKK